MESFYTTKQTTNRFVVAVSAQDTQAAAAALALQQKQAQNQPMRTQAVLRDRSVKLMLAKGLLNVRGVLAEDNSPIHFSVSDPGRGTVWKAILAHRIHQGSNLACLQQQASRSGKTKNLHLDIGDIH